MTKFFINESVLKNKPKLNKSYTFYLIGKDSSTTTESVEDDGTKEPEVLKTLNNKYTYCYSVISEGKENFFIKMNGSKPFNVLEIHDFGYIKGKNWRWKKTTKSVFENYIKYSLLQSPKYGKITYYNLVERMI